MISKFLISITATVLGIAGLACLFAPDELSRLYYPSLSASPLLLVQLLGATLLGLAALNWLSKNSMIGGIYGRPLTMANLTHFLIGGLVMLRGVASDSNRSVVWSTTIVYALLTVIFAMVLFGRAPFIKPSSNADTQPSPPERQSL